MCAALSAFFPLLAERVTRVSTMLKCLSKPMMKPVQLPLMERALRMTTSIFQWFL